MKLSQLDNKSERSWGVFLRLVAILGFIVVVSLFFGHGVGAQQPSGNTPVSGAATTSNSSGIGACTNKVVTGLNANAAPTCTTLTSAYVDSSIQPALGFTPAKVLCKYTTDATPHTGDSNYVVYRSCTIPANAMGTNGTLRFVAVAFNTTGNTGACRVKVNMSTAADINGTTFIDTGTGVTGANRSWRVFGEISNRNAAGAQVGMASEISSTSTVVGAPMTTASLDTTQTYYLNVIASNSVAGDTCNVSYFIVELLP